MAGKQDCSYLWITYSGAISKMGGHKKPFKSKIQDSKDTLQQTSSFKDSALSKIIHVQQKQMSATIITQLRNISIGIQQQKTAIKPLHHHNFSYSQTLLHHWLQNK